MAFRELRIAPNRRAVFDSQQWSNPRIHHADLGRLHLRALEAILSPCSSSADIINAVVFGVTSQGLRVTQRDDSRGQIIAERIEAPYLASFSGRRGSGIEKEEWRVVVATLGVTKALASWGGVQRIMLLEFMTDPCPKQDLAGKSAAAVASLAERINSAAFGMGMSSRDFVGTKYSSVAAIARERSNQRADALIESVAAELVRINCHEPASLSVDHIERRDSEHFAAKEECNGQDESRDPGDNQQSASVDSNEGPSAGVTLVPLDTEGRQEGSNRRSEKTNEGTSDGVDADGETDNEKEIRNPNLDSVTVEVFLCSHFVDELCARAVDYSRRDAQETWQPLKDTVRRLERDNGHLRHLLEPRYRTLGITLPPIPTWTDRRRAGPGSIRRDPSVDAIERSSSSDETMGTWHEDRRGRRTIALWQSSRLFAVSGSFVKARLRARGSSTLAELELQSKTPVNRRASAVDGSPGQINGGSTAANARSDRNGDSNVDVQAASDRHPDMLIQTAVKELVREVGSICEAREEDILKESMPGAQAYISELEAYRTEIVGGKALQAVDPRCNIRDKGGDRKECVDGDCGLDDRKHSGQHRTNGGSLEIDDDLWRLFGAMEIRLYTSPAAMGKKPGKIFITPKTLWFHSKVLNFETRYVLPLSEVKSVTLMGTAMDMSSSLVIDTNEGKEIMLVFPGQRTSATEPVALLLRELAALAGRAKEDTDDCNSDDEDTIASVSI